MKILISGATGFIGKHLVRRLVEENHIVHTIVRPCPEINSLIASMEKEKFDGIIHLASFFLAKHESKDIESLIDSNITLGTKLLEAATRSRVSWFINTGTFWQHYKNKNYNPVNLYAATKQAFEDVAKYYIETSNLNFVTLELSDTFGPEDTRPKIFNLWLKASKNKETLDMSPGKQTLDINYIDDVVGGYMQMIGLLSRDKKRSLRGKKFSLNSTKRYTLRELASVFEKVTKTKLNINWGKKEYRPREVMVPWNKGVKIPGWKPKISIEKGIRKMYE